jgi:hypothetical protein
VGDRVVVLGDLEKALLGTIDGLLDGQRHLVRLPVADAHDALLVAHDHQRREREAAAALDHLGDAIDGHDALLEV